MMHTSVMPYDVALFNMLEQGQLAALDRERLEGEMERINQMLDRVTDYQRAVMAALNQCEKAEGPSAPSAEL